MLDLPDFLTRDAKHNQIDLTGHRIGRFHVVYHHRLGESVERIVDGFPSLEIDLVRRVIDFYEANRAEVDAYMADYQAELDRQQAAYQGPTLEEMRARMRRRLAEKS